MTISEVSKKFNISPYTLRYYEEISLIPPVKRNKCGVRDYGESDLKWIEFIKFMRSAGLSIEILIKYAELFMQGKETIVTRMDILVEQKNQLVVKMENIKEIIDKLDDKIEVHKNAIMKKESCNMDDLI